MWATMSTKFRNNKNRPVWVSSNEVSHPSSSSSSAVSVVVVRRKEEYSIGLVSVTSATHRYPNYVETIEEPAYLSAEECQ